ncbi:MAG: DUF1552 domain-containing protein, partial [Verrucomicrobiota bacterium]
MQTRRDALKTLGLAAGGFGLATPPLYAAAAIPKRFVFIVKSNGLRPYGIMPEGHEEIGIHGADKMLDVGLEQERLNACMARLEPLKEHVNIIQGLSSRVTGGNHDFGFGALGGYKSQRRPLAATVDGMLSTLGESPFPFVGFDMAPGKLISYPIISAVDTDRNLPYFASPTQAYLTLFGSVSNSDDVQKQIRLEQFLLNYVARDIQRTKGRMPPSGQDKLDMYRQGYEALIQRHERMSGLTGLKTFAPTYTDQYKSPVETDIFTCQMELATAALQAGLTRVVTLHADTLGLRYTGLKQEFNVHAIGHMEDSGRTGSGEVVGSEDEGRHLGARMRHQIRDFHFEQIAKMAKRLAAIPEGDGTMLDNTVIVYLSDGAEGHHSRCWEWPMVVLGNIDSKLKTGRFVDYPAYGHPGHRTTA